MEKEKELAIAVARVESLTQQLDKQRKGWSQSTPSREKTHQELELERLRKELMVRMRDLTAFCFVAQVLRDRHAILAVFWQRTRLEKVVVL